MKTLATASLVHLFLIAALAGGEVPAKKVLLLGQGPDGHPAGTHEYMAGLAVLAKCLEKAPGLEVVIERADEPWSKGPELIDQADGVVIFLSQGAKWVHDDPRRLDALARLAQRKGGLVGLHWGIGTREAEPIAAYLKLLGGCHGGPDRKFAVVEADVKLAAPGHPVLHGIADFRARDEFYYQLKLVEPPDGIQPLWRVSIEGQEHTVAWSWDRPDGGRSLGFSGLHFHENWRLAEYRRLAAQGVLWTLGLPIPDGGLDVSVAEEDLRLAP